MRHASTWGLLALAACGGEAIIDPPLGGGGAGSGSSSSSASTSSGPSVSISVTTGTGMLTCEQANALYRQLIERAKECSSDLPVVQCTELVPDDLFCPCQTAIDLSDAQLANEISEVVDAFIQQGCLDPPPPCPPVACVEVLGGECVNDTCRDVTN